jgi:hypothetical protein
VKGIEQRGQGMAGRREQDDSIVHSRALTCSSAPHASWTVNWRLGWPTKVLTSIFILSSTAR